MNWDALGAIGEIVGAVGVIGTLGYLAFQVHQNTAQLRQNELAAKAAAVSASTIALRENRRSIFESAELTDIWLKGLAQPDELSDAESYRFRLVVQNVTDAMWDMYSQTVVTGFSRDTWETHGVPFVERILDTPGGRWYWSKFSETYMAEFRKEVDSILGVST
jgi:hypothetical protein